MRRKYIAFTGLTAVAAMLLGTGGLLLRRQISPRESGVESSEPRMPTSPAAAGSSAPRKDARAERDALRERIVHALEHQARPTSSAPPTPTSGLPNAPGNLTNRIGDRRQPLVDYLNDDFMPLAGECIDQAEARDPRLKGMLAISIEIVADEQLGGVIDWAEPAPTNRVSDQELIECIRQSALSVILPAPLITGREQFEITLRIGEAPEGVYRRDQSPSIVRVAGGAAARPPARR
jgi:hypothetical protein